MPKTFLKKEKCFHHFALGIGAASFASVFGTTGFGDGEWDLLTRLGSGGNLSEQR